ncbi:hypothetical protein ACN6MY_17025 [Peribacillus sp. B-H-3]|uniref:hypothetical protein n=1 Tax=Peribacillus sp. B-H-3 TaxID=3400420 RepID=UPI003B0224B9
MNILECQGYELEKEKSNSPEEFFNRSAVRYIEGGAEKTLTVLYLRYFDGLMEKYTPYKANPLFQCSGRDVCLSDIAALVCLMADSGFKERKRVYVNSEEDFFGYFKTADFHLLQKIFIAISNGSQYEIL